MPNGTIERKCTKGHNKAEGRCSPRCVRWYPRVQRTAPDGHGRRRFDYLGGYPSKAAARSALDQALRRHRGLPSDPSIIVRGSAPPTLNDLLDHWLAHLQTNKALRLRTVGRYRQLLEHHLRPHLGTVPLSVLSTLQVQRLYDQLAQGLRKDGKAGGLGPRTIRQLHLCLHQALGYAMKWHDLPANPAADTEPPAIPTHRPAALTPRAGRYPARRRPAGTAAVAARLHHPGGGDRRPHRRAVRPGMAGPRPGGGHAAVPPGAVQHRPAARDRPAASRRRP